MGKISIDWDNFIIYIFPRTPRPSEKKIPQKKINPPPLRGDDYEFPNLKNNKNSKEIMTLIHIHDTCYVYSIGTPPPPQTKKNLPHTRGERNYGFSNTET